MSQEYPRSCSNNKCDRKLYGPVKFCPFCGTCQGEKPPFPPEIVLGDHGGKAAVKEIEAGKFTEKIVEPSQKERNRRPYIEFVSNRFEQGSFDRNELIEAVMQEFPEVTKDNIGQFLSDSKNPKYSSFKDREVIDHPITGKLIFGDRIKASPSMQYVENQLDKGALDRNDLTESIMQKYPGTSRDGVEKFVICLTNPKDSFFGDRHIVDHPTTKKLIFKDRIQFSETAETVATATQTSRPKWKLIMAALIVLAAVGYLLINHYHIPVSGSGEVSPSSHTPPGAARLAALEALRQGAMLSETVSKVPRLGKVVQAAKKLVEIDPNRYEPELDSSEAILSSAVKERDKLLLVYIDKVLRLKQYTPRQVSYAIDSIGHSDITTREKLVLELLSKHFKSLQNGAEPNPKRWLSDFDGRFSNYIE